VANDPAPAIAYLDRAAALEHLEPRPRHGLPDNAVTSVLGGHVDIELISIQACVYHFFPFLFVFVDESFVHNTLICKIA
jgi:hypothetical protein